jgi:putative ATPase
MSHTLLLFSVLSVKFLFAVSFILIILLYSVAKILYKILFPSFYLKKNTNNEKKLCHLAFLHFKYITLQHNMAEPLAERMRPRTLDDYIGQKHLVGEGAVLRGMIDAGRISSFILWGPPGVGKTTLAQIIANKLETPFYTLSAVTSGVKDVREVIDRAKNGRFFNSASPILFIDEIHRFSKSQQDSLLGAVERGIVTLIGATTENPSFEVIRPLLSRCQLYVLKPLDKEDLLQLLRRAIENDVELKKRHIELRETSAMLRYSGGDARKLLNILELVVEATPAKEDVVVTDDVVVNRLQQNPLAYDKDGEMHYDIISAFIKSIRGSDPDAALYWMARMIEGGEDPQFIARRMVISASEDIGLANPNALLLANATFDAVMKIGWPEGRIPLAECAVYLATSPKSNSAYMGIGKALEVVKQTGNQPVPLHLRNAPTKLMADLGYSDGYKYAHDYPGNFVVQQFLPDELRNERFWHAQHSPSEEKLYQRMLQCWGDRFKK